MLVNLKEVLDIAEEKKIAIGSFNTPNLESVMAVVKAAEELDVPVILMHAEVHDSILPLEIIGPIMINCAKLAKVPVCVHLDHGVTLEYLQRAVDMGFTSIMFDGSELSYEENVDKTIKAVEMSKDKGVSVEAEIGVLGKREMGHGHDDDDDQPEEIYTDPDLAEQFIKETGIDALACSFGTAHGLYLKKPQLDMTVLEKITKRVNTPLVMHGGSGVSTEDYINVIERGVRKINYFTYMSKSGAEGAKEVFGIKESKLNLDNKEIKLSYYLNEADKEKAVYFHDIALSATDKMKENVKKALTVFSRK